MQAAGKTRSELCCIKHKDIAKRLSIPALFRNIIIIEIDDKNMKDPEYMPGQKIMLVYW
jgi:hypothetical protein